MSRFTILNSLDNNDNIDISGIMIPIIEKKIDENKENIKIPICNNNVLDSNNILRYITSQNNFDFDENYFLSVNKLEKDIECFIRPSNLIILQNLKRGYDIELDWMNEKYKNLIKLNITLKYISKDILDFYNKI